MLKSVKLLFAAIKNRTIETWQGNHDDVIVYIFARLHMALHTEGNMLYELTPGS